MKRLSQRIQFIMQPRLTSRVRGIALLAAGILLGMASCAAPAPLLSLQPERTLESEDYEATLKRWTRKDDVFDGLFSVMFAHATFHSPEFRRAFLERFPEFYGRGSEEGQRLTLADPEAETHWAFFLAVSTSNQRWNDLARSDSIWRVTLQSDEGPEVEAKVSPIGLDYNIRIFYPYLTPFSSGYRLEFPLTNLEGRPIIHNRTRTIRLRISSALGAAELIWEFEPMVSS